MRKELDQMKLMVAELSLKNRVLKKSLLGLNKRRILENTSISPGGQANTLGAGLLNGTFPVPGYLRPIKEKLQLFYSVGSFNHYQGLEIHFVDYSRDICDPIVNSVIFF